MQKRTILPGDHGFRRRRLSQTQAFADESLGYTSVTANSSGGKVAELRYHPWGGTRYTDGVTPTARRFTGQIEDAAIGLYFYNARYYDPSLSRFISPDSIVPAPQSPQSLNRYAYCLNNPLRYTDPTGHFTSDAIINYLKENYPGNWPGMWDIWRNDTAWASLLSNAQGGDYFAIDSSEFDSSVMLLQFLGKGEDVLEGIAQISQIGTIPQGITLEDVRTDKYGIKISGLLRFDSEGNTTIVHQTNPFVYDKVRTEISSYRRVTWLESAARKISRSFVELVTCESLLRNVDELLSAVGELALDTVVDYNQTSLDYNKGDRIVNVRHWTLSSQFSTAERGLTGYEPLGSFDFQLP